MDDQELAWAMGLLPEVAVLVAVLEERSVTRAAERLSTPQSSVTRAVARLQRDLDVVLVERLGRGIAPTEQALAMLPHLRRARDAALDARAALLGTLDPSSGRVRVGFLHSLGLRDVPALVGRFRERYPDVAFGLHQGSRERLLDDVAAGDLDLALIAPPPDDDRGQVAVKALRFDPLILVVPPGHRFAGRAGIDLADAAGEPFVTVTEGHGLRRVADELARAAGIVPRVAFEVENADTLRGMVAAGLGVGIVESGAPTAAVEVPITAPEAGRTVAAVWNRDRVPLPVARAFREFVVAEGPGLLAGR